jgi:hypothetical protein
VASSLPNFIGVFARRLVFLFTFGLHASLFHTHATRVLLADATLVLYPLSTRSLKVKMLHSLFFVRYRFSWLMRLYVFCSKLLHFNVSQLSRIILPICCGMTPFHATFPFSARISVLFSIPFTHVFNSLSSSFTAVQQYY